MKCSAKNCKRKATYDMCLAIKVKPDDEPSISSCITPACDYHASIVPDMSIIPPYVWKGICDDFEAIGWDRPSIEHSYFVAMKR